MTTPTMALVATCYDRWEFVERTLPTWRRLDGAPPIFVGTYEGDRVPSWADDVYLVTVRGEPFHLTRLRNAVAREARKSFDPDYLLFIDADIEVADPEVFADPLDREDPPDFLVDSPFALVDEYVVLREDDPERAEPGKRGTVVVRSELFFEIGGYDQRLMGWGMDDRNLYERLRDAGGRPGCFDRERIVHVPHEEELRHRHNPGGVGRIPRWLANLKVHMGSYDLRGTAWAEEFGYPDVTVRPPPVAERIREEER